MELRENKQRHPDKKLRAIQLDVKEEKEEKE